MTTPLLTHNGERFVWRGDYATRAAPRQAGFRWDRTRKHWWTKDSTRAERLRAEADTAAMALLGDVAAEVEASHAQDADFEVPVPDGLTLLPFQRAGVAYMLGRRATLLGDHMGLGKTVQAAGVLNADPTARRVLVLCPASLRLNWRRELERWMVRPAPIYLPTAKTFPEAADDQIVVVHYDILWRLRDRLREREWDVVIADECHRLKSPGAQRTRAVLGTFKRGAAGPKEPIPAKRWALLSGTPIVNRPIELWPLLRVLDPDGLGQNWHDFVTRYCEGHRGQWGWEVKGASHLDELQRSLRSTCMIRRLKSEVLADLPRKRRQVIELPDDGAKGAVATERGAWESRQEGLEDLRARLELAKATEDEGEYREAVDALREGEFAAFAEISKLRHATALSKVPVVVEHVSDAVESSGAVVVFAHHKDVVAAIAAEFGPAAVTLTGDTPMEARQAAVDRFQTDPACTVFIGTIGAAGVGITLTKSSHVIFSELSYVPGDVTQAEDRLHRIGQEQSVLVQHLVLEGSIDAEIARTLVRKQEVIDRALDVGGPPPEIDVEAIEERGGGRASRAGLEREGAALSAEQVAYAHQGVRILAGQCDGAAMLDGQGFSAFDARIGHELAAMPGLTPRQAALARKVLRKYRRTQLPGEIGAALWPEEDGDGRTD